MDKKYPFQKFTLPNGLTVLLYKMDSIMSTYAVLYVRVGAIYEKQKERGLSHLTEHLAFLGTDKYPSPTLISQEAEQRGMLYNGGTSQTSTYYSVHLPHNFINYGLEMLHQFVFKPKEKEVVISEYQDFWHNPERHFYHKIWRKRFRQKEHPYSFRPMGIPASINKLDISEVKKWRDNFYNPSNMVLSIAGNINTNDLEKRLKETFGKEKSGKIAEEPVFANDDYSGFTSYLQKDPRPQIIFILTFPVFGWRENKRIDRQKLRILNRILGGGQSSRLYERLRRKERLVYRVGSNYSLHSWMGGLEIQGSVPVEKLTITLKNIKEELDKVINLGISKNELIRAKGFLSASIQMQFDNPPTVASFLGSQEFDKEEIWFPDDYIRAGERVTREDIHKMAKNIFDYPRLNLGLLGNVPNKTVREIEKIFH